MRNKTLFAAAVAFVMAIGGAALSAADSMDLVAKMDVSLKNNLTSAAEQEGKDFGYKKQQTGEFHSLSSAMNAATENGGKATIQLGTFNSGEKIQFGYATADGNDFTAAPVKVASDPGYSYSYDPQSFYTLDFSNSAFDGSLEIVAVGSPLPASTVTLIVALGAAAAMLLYANRRKQVRISEQA